MAHCLLILLKYSCYVFWVQEIFKNKKKVEIFIVTVSGMQFYSKSLSYHRVETKGNGWPDTDLWLSSLCGAAPLGKCLPEVQSSSLHWLQLLPRSHRGCCFGSSEFPSRCAEQRQLSWSCTPLTLSVGSGVAKISCLQYRDSTVVTNLPCRCQQAREKWGNIINKNDHNPLLWIHK